MSKSALTFLSVGTKQCSADFMIFLNKMQLVELIVLKVMLEITTHKSQWDCLVHVYVALTLPLHYYIYFLHNDCVITALQCSVQPNFLFTL